MYGEGARHSAGFAGTECLTEEYYPVVEMSDPIENSATTQHQANLVADGLVSVREAALFLSVSRSKLYELMDNGELKFVKLGRSRRIPRRALIDLAASGLQGGWRS